jgi:ABC-type sugar transport system substrate-binding protein
VGTAVHIVKRQPVEKQVFIPFQLVTKENVANLLPKK